MTVPMTFTTHNLEYFAAALDRIEAIAPGERITAPAIRLDDGRVFSVNPPEVPSVSAPTPTYKRVEGQVLLARFTGKIHKDMLGFLTSEGRFARPRLAMKIATLAGQIARPLKDGKLGLQPADLWP